MTDQEILLLCRNTATREQGFRQLVSEYTKKVYWHIRRMVNDHDDANDVVQNCFIKVWKGLDQFREDSKLYTWIYRIATNEAITFLNDKYRKNSISMDTSEEGPAASLRADYRVDGDHIQKQLALAINTLPDKQKQVFLLRYYDEMKYEEMEQVLGTSVGALKASFHHAVKKIETFIKDGLNPS